MSVLGEHPLMEGGPPPLVPGLWRPALWCTPTPRVPELPVYPQPRSMTHLLSDYITTTSSPPLWYPWYFKGESLYKRTSPLDDRESPNKELPSKLLKHDRVKERQDLCHTLNFDKDHAARLNSKKSAGTQTQFTSFNGDSYPYYPCETVPADSSYSLRTLYPPPPPPPPPPSHPSHDQHPNIPSHPPELPSPDIQNAPLNLSLSSGGSPPPLRPQIRPSVITCAAPTSSPGNSSSQRYGCSSPEERQSPPANVPAAVVTDPAIEEHFRRSLGHNYKDSIQTKTTTTTVTAATAVHANVSITGSVDDHFAKSLGDTTWTAIKAKSDPVKDMFAGSVDDHFAKALGDTWLRIKAEKESNCHGSSCSSPSGSPPHASIVTT
ncbi:transcription cofactor vestigial-like protein 4 isoform X1 [Haliotis asinina]|uniref:transcription cofactor vestigial-like protein 4 isoform X1 n=1 Tax=Haliotis asinina TaxID=109174 RepID=UPI003531F504